MYSISIACNDENGNFKGKVFSIEFYIIGESILKMDSVDITDGIEYHAYNYPSKILYFNKMLVIKHLGITEFAGNMCWNEYQVSESGFFALLNYIYSLEQYSLDEGLTILVDMLELGEIDQEKIKIIIDHVIQ